MKSNVVTDIELRSRWYANREETVVVPSGAVFTPAAKDFIRENNIKIVIGNDFGEGQFASTPFPKENGRPVYVDAASGEKLYEKKENYTHLRGNVLVHKSHPQIAFRGKLDSLMADIIQIQVTACDAGETKLVNDLDDVLFYTRKILSAEVTDKPLKDLKLLGMDSKALRYTSQNVKECFGIEHPVPSYQHGAVCAALNKLRTASRECELSAVYAFADGKRMDIIEALNRLSSGIYILYCRKLSGYYGGGFRR